MEYLFYPFFLLLRILRLIPIITGSCHPSDIGAARIGQTQGPFSTVQLFGASTRVCIGLTTAIRFRRKCSMEVIALTPSLFGRRVSIMELLFYLLKQYGMLSHARVLLLFSASAMGHTFKLWL
jgi:hypothetical protein